MNSNVENLMLEHLKRIQDELAALRDRVADNSIRLGRMASGIARLARAESANYSEIVADRHAVDKLAERVERIERRLELSP